MRRCDALIWGKDEPGRYFLEYLLRSEGYAIEAYSLLSEILPSFMSKKYRCALLTSGRLEPRELKEALECLRIIRELDSEIPVIVVAKEMSLEIERKFRREGIFYFLARPFTSSELIEVVRCAVRKSREADFKSG